MRYYVRYMNGTFKLPSPEEMTRHWEEEKIDRASRGFTRRQAHMMGPDQVDLILVHHISAINNFLTSTYVKTNYKNFETKVERTIDSDHFMWLQNI